MKILILYPNLYGMNTLPPAIGLFTAILRAEGHDLALFDSTVYEGLYGAGDSDRKKSENLNARPFDDTILREGALHSDAETDFRQLVSQFDPDLIAMSATEDMYPVGVNLLESLGGRRPPVVLGGVFGTFVPEMAIRLSRGTIDYVLRGEGEETLPEFCRRLSRGEDLLNLPGLYCIDRNGREVSNPLPTPVNLDNLPLPDFSLFADSRYYRPMQGKMRRMLPIQTVRGCPYTCGYCNSPAQIQIHKAESHRFFRASRIANVRREIEQAVTRYQADSIYFWADTFLAWTNAEFDEFCDMYADFKLPFWIQTRPENVTERRFRRLKEVGLLRVAFGVEHGNDEFRQKLLARKVKNDTIAANLNIVNALDIPISVNNIIGFPTETRELAFDTIELNRRFNSDGINSYSFTPFHGTPLRKLAEDLGYVTRGELARSIMAPTMVTMPHFPVAEIEGIRRCFVLYVKMPHERWPEIRQAEAIGPGDELFAALKAECLEHHMQYGDYEKNDDPDAAPDAAVPAAACPSGAAPT